MFDFLESILFELKQIPGMSFLRNLHMNLVTKRQRITKKLENVNHRRNTLASTSRKLKGLATPKGSKRREG